MKENEKQRVDEVSRYYKPAATIEHIGTALFWVIALVSLVMPYTAQLNFLWQNILHTAFIVIVLIYFSISQIVKFYLVPTAERIRRKELLSNAFDAPLTHVKTSLYYNNEYSPSIERLGANTMENALFSKEVSAKMLFARRLITAGYLIVWVVAFALRHNNLDILIWLTQIVFSSEVIVRWINLEVLHWRFENVYEQLHTHFLHGVGDKNPVAVATVLDAFITYEAAKSSAGVLLSTRLFQRLNPSLTEKWSAVRSELNMNAVINQKAETQ